LWCASVVSHPGGKRGESVKSRREEKDGLRAPARERKKEKRNWQGCDGLLTLSTKKASIHHRGGEKRGGRVRPAILKKRPRQVINHGEEGEERQGGGSVHVSGKKTYIPGSPVLAKKGGAGFGAQRVRFTAQEGGGGC